MVARPAIVSVGRRFCNRGARQHPVAQGDRDPASARRATGRWRHRDPCEMMGSMADAPVLPPPRLRAEVVHVTDASGADVLVDLLTDRVIHLTADQSAALRAEQPDLMVKLGKLALLETPETAALRRRIAAARLSEPPAPAPAPPTNQIDWSEAAAWPDMVSSTWRDPECLRRLAEDRAAGRRYLTLRGFLEPGAARAIADQVRALPHERFESDLVRANKCLLADHHLPDWRALLASPLTRRLLGGVVGRTLPPRTTINAWHMEPGDGMGVHPDGRLYWATISLGLCEDWAAADGGAIAFGEPRPDGTFEVRERWLPHLGDLCLFVPSRTSWHLVEPARRERRTLTGWWVSA